jgi:hypothetical protein
MKLKEIFKNAIARTSPSDSLEMRSLVIMQRKPHRFSEDELRGAAERGWGKRFDGVEDPMFFVSVDHRVLTVVKAGRHIIRVISIPARYSDDDEYALSQLPQPEQKKAWTEHRACVLLELLNDLHSKSTPDVEAFASLAKLALELGDPNCAAIFLPDRNIMMPNDGTAEQCLRMLVKGELPLKGWQQRIAHFFSGLF